MEELDYFNELQDKLKTCKESEGVSKICEYVDLGEKHDIIRTNPNSEFTLTIKEGSDIIKYLNKLEDANKWLKTELEYSNHVELEKETKAACDNGYIMASMFVSRSILSMINNNELKSVEEIKLLLEKIKERSYLDDVDEITNLFKENTFLDIK